MKNKINIEDFKKRNPFDVPEDYFINLTHDIMDKVDDTKERSIFSLKTLPISIGIAATLVFGIWFFNSDTEVTNHDLIEVLAYYQVEDELLYEYIELEEEIQIDDYLIDQFDYNELINEF